MAIDMYDLLRRGATQTSGVAPSSFDTEVQKRLAEMVQRRALGATGAAPVAPPAVPITPVATPVSAAESILTRPISAWGALKTVGTAAKGLAKRFAGPAALVATGAGALASKMAGGGAIEGASRPDLLARALGEGYANLAPEFMGGLSPTSVAAGEFMGASDIGGDFDARMRPDLTGARPTPKPAAGAWGAMGRSDEYSGSSTEPADVTARYAAAGVLPPVTPFTAEDIRGTRVPVSGTGAFINTRTGAVTNSTPAWAPTAEDWEATNLRNRGIAVYGPDGLGRSQQLSPVAGAVGAMMNQRRAAATRASDAATNKLLMEYALKAPGAQESAGKAQIHAATLELARRAADSGATPAEVSAILANRAPVAGPTFGESVTSLPDPKTGALTLIQRTGPGAGAVRKVAPQQKITAANVDAALAGSMKGKSRAEVIQMYKNRGYDITGVQ